MSFKVLIVDDEPSILHLLAQLLAVEGFRVEACASAKEACQYLQRESVDLVITDMRMETPTSGYEVLRAVQRLPHSPPVILFTAFPIPPADLQGYGVASVLMKGSSTTALVGKARELLQRPVSR
jgi:two-component system, NtrC family, response regulator PilR